MCASESSSCAATPSSWSPRVFRVVAVFPVVGAGLCASVALDSFNTVGASVCVIVLQYVAVCCTLLRCLENGALEWVNSVGLSMFVNMLQHVAVCCDVWRLARFDLTLSILLGKQSVAVFCSVFLCRVMRVSASTTEACIYVGI